MTNLRVACLAALLLPFIVPGYALAQASIRDGEALADSFDYGTAALTEQTDRTMVEAAANTRFDRFMGPSVKARVVYFVIGHTWDIYG